MVAAFLTLFLMACAPAIYPATTWDFIQQHRSQDGLSRFEWDDSLLPVLNQRAQHLAENLELNHDGLKDAYNASPAYDRDICEIGGKQPLDALPDSVGFGIVESPPHHACLDDPKYTRGAIAAYVGADGWVYEVMWLTD